MPALNFKEKFVHLVETGVKNQTIRKVRKNPIKIGDTLYLYTGMRTKKCRALKVVVCTSVKDIKIYAHGIFINNKMLSNSAKYNLAKKDGFGCIDDFRWFFEKQYGLPFLGTFITW